MISLDNWEWWKLENQNSSSKEIQIRHRLFLAIAMYCQASSVNH